MLSFVKIGAVKAILRGVSGFLSVLFHIYYPIWVKLGIKYLHVMMLSMKSNFKSNLFVVSQVCFFGCDC
jgi:hypothetical protein